MLILKPDEFPTPDTWFKLFVSYGETDAMGVVYYANYAHWFERARGQLIRERGISYAEVERRGVILPVREMSLRYLAPATYDDEIWVRAGISSFGRASMIFSYQVFGPPEHSRLICAGFTAHACLNPSRKPVAVPGWLRELFTA